MTRCVAMKSRAADVVFVAVGKPGLVTVAIVMKNAVLAMQMQMAYYQETFATAVFRGSCGPGIQPSVNTYA